MNFDVITIAALVHELRMKLLNGRVQDSLEIGNDAIGFEIYAGQRHYLMLSANPQAARVHLVSDRVRKGVEHPSPLGLMLRRNIEGGRLVGISQPPWERILHFQFESGEGAFTLIAEIMDRRSNLLLVRDGEIMDCMRRVGADENRVRVSLPGQPYVPPPPQLGKHDPTT
ncbi:MAG: NFACT family protein, partial [Anaerolineae bacterium]|nr:NFACT family protein [Anaerolineae bacterium]